MFDKNFSIYKNLKVVVTGSTGFKGSWLCFWLYLLGSKVTGVSLKPEKDSILFKNLQLFKKINQKYLDIRNFKSFNDLIKKEKPDLIFHLAAQSVVSESYYDPLKTLSTNIMGSSNILETVRLNKIKNLVFITSDKCYLNDERNSSYKETDKLGGEDLYSSSKACAELTFEAYLKSFNLNNSKIKLSSVRAGNVIGGGDMKKDRIVPDVIKFIKNHSAITIRSPYATRPWQHVLEPLSGYLKLGSLSFNDKISANLSPNWNFGPNKVNNRNVLEVVKKILFYWGIKKKIKIVKNKKFKEAKLLMINNKKAKKELNWYPRLNFDETIKLTVDWYKSYYDKINIEKKTQDQINYYLSIK